MQCNIGHQDPHSNIPESEYAEELRSLFVAKVKTTHCKKPLFICCCYILLWSEYSLWVGFWIFFTSKLKTGCIFIFNWEFCISSDIHLVVSDFSSGREIKLFWTQINIFGNTLESRPLYHSSSRWLVTIIKIRPHK